MYYRDSQIRVTDHAIEIGNWVLPITELRYVWHREGRPTARTTSRRIALYAVVVLLLGPAAVALILGAVLTVSQYGVAASLTAAVVLVGLAIIALVLVVPLLEFPLMALERSYDRGTRVREIWVRWDGRDLLLVRTSDSARFGQIYRAIERAVERTDL